MLQRPVDVKARNEASGVDADIGDQLGKLILEPLREDDEEVRQIVLHFPDGCLGEAAETKSVIGQENQNSL